MSDRELESEQPRKRVRLSSPDGVLKLDQTVTVDELIAAQLEQEKRVGISSFAAHDPGFSCVLKQRYTDFLVNEITPSGKVVHLDAPPTPVKKEEPKKPQPEEPKDESKDALKAEPPAEPKDGSNAEPTEGTTSEMPSSVPVEAKGTNGHLAEATAAPSQHEASQDGLSETVPGMHPSRAANLAGEETAQQYAEKRKQAAIDSISAEDKSTLIAMFGETTTSSMIGIYSKIAARPDRKARDYGSIQSGEIADKQDRTDAHVAVRRIFKGAIETVTSGDNTISIKGSAAPQRHERNPQKGGAGPKVKGKVGWDELGGEHLHFTLYKENKDTMEVLVFLASQIKCQPKIFQMAGTKDRRGVTCQRISAYRTTKERLAGFNPRLRQAMTSGYEYQKKGLELGELQGNEFTITLRDCRLPGTDDMDPKQRLDLAKNTISKSMEMLRTQGFINYYGLQRFGTFATSTHEIGRRMLKGDFAGAVAGILTFSPLALSEAQNPTENSKISIDDKARAEAIHIWNTTHKPGNALDKLPRRFQAENAVIRHLGWSDRKTGDQSRLHDYQSALMQITRNLRLMYVHAYQSFVWNTVAGKRWQQHGSTVIEGDLVLIGEHKTSSSKTVTAPVETIDDDGEVIIRPSADDSAASAFEKFDRARALTAEEAASGQYTIFDVVLPLPGFDVVYPKNELGDFYKEFMGSEIGGGLDPYNMRRGWKDISLSGGYRKVMARVGALEWEVKTYTQSDEQLVLTDSEKIHGKTLESVNGVDDNAMEGVEGQREKIALVVKMQLGSSQYATMALRELTKGGAIGYKPDFQGGR